MNLMQKLFGMAPAQPAQPAQQTPAAPQTPALPGNIPPQNNMPAAANNPTAPAATVNATANTPNNGAATPDAPQGLDAFKDVWNLTDAEKPKVPEAAFAGVTPEAIQQVAGKTDFSKVVTPDLLSKISAGGEEGVAATLAALNLVAQQTFAQSSEAAIKVATVAAQKERENMMAELPNMIKQQTVSNNLRTKNPIFEHPAAAPMLQSLQQQLQLKNPTATPEQIQAKAEEFLVSFATAANPQKPQQQTIANKGTDFSDWV